VGRKDLYKSSDSWNPPRLYPRLGKLGTGQARKLFLPWRLEKMLVADEISVSQRDKGKQA
jgi:hypothetical protein